MSWNIASSPTLQGCGSNPADKPLVRKAAAKVCFDYPTAVTPSVTSPTTVLRRNMAHRYTDSVTIMAVVRRCTNASRACYARTRARASGPHVAYRVLMKRRLM